MMIITIRINSSDDNGSATGALHWEWTVYIYIERERDIAVYTCMHACMHTCIHTYIHT